jgi:UDP-N-acetylglucosamine/UDP-N-acetylgalactosamine diphosphorylase
VAENKDELARLLAAHGQEHVLSFWGRLSKEERASLAQQIRELDFGLLAKIGKSAPSITPEKMRLEAEPFKRLPTDEASRREWDDARAAGQEALAAGRAAAMVVAGGQGTRLGFDGPKGEFPIGPVSERTLFQIHAEKVLAASRRCGREIPLLVMTGPSNDAKTRYFFKAHNFFGLPFTSVRIFEQGEMPAVDDNGRIVLDAPGHIFVSPNGHGGSLKALWDSGTVEWLEGKGIDVISYFQVDNPLVRALDPAFIGFHTGAGADMSLKLVARTDPDEKLGIWLSAEGRAKIIEYSDMPRELMHATDESGSLKFAGGSIAIHCFSVPFVRRLNKRGFALPYHRARKKVPFADASGKTVTPTEPNATKFEMFVFDALEFAGKAAAVETAREEEFSPVKNKEGADSPETARRDMSRLYGKWLSAIGVEVPADDKGYPLHKIEISPLVGDDEKTLEMNYRGPRSVTGPLLVSQ